MTIDDVSADYTGDREIRVYANCVHDWIDERTVEVVDASEAFQGADMVAFLCPRCGRIHVSTRRGF